MMRGEDRKVCPLSIIGSDNNNNVFRLCCESKCTLWFDNECCLKTFLLGLRLIEEDKKPEYKEVV